MPLTDSYSRLHSVRLTHTQMVQLTTGCSSFATLSSYSASRCYSGWERNILTQASRQQARVQLPSRLVEQGSLQLHAAHCKTRTNPQRSTTPVQNAHLALIPTPRRTLESPRQKEIKVSALCAGTALKTAHQAETETTAVRHQTFHLAHRTSLEKSQGCPSLQEKRASCLASLTWIGPHQYAIHYWCIHAHLVTQTWPKPHFLASGKHAVSVSPFTTIVPSTPTTAKQGAAYGSPQLSANRQGQKKKNYLLRVSHPLLLLHVSISFPHCGFRTALRRGDRARLLWGIQWKDKSYQWFQGKFQ